MVLSKNVLRASVLAAVIASMTMSSAFAAHNSRPFQMPPGWPKALTIPRFAINAKVEAISLNKPADFHAPYEWNDVAWYSRGARPGSVGHADIFGHLDSTCCPAIFWHLKDLRKGDTVVVTYRTGQSITFRVQWTGVYLNANVPLAFMYGPARQRGLILLTCTGVFHRDGTGYDHKLLVYARMVMPNGRLG